MKPTPPKQDKPKMIKVTFYEDKLELAPLADDLVIIYD